MSAAIFSKWGRIELGLPVTIDAQDLQRVTIRDFIDIAADTGLKIEVKRLGQGSFRLLVTA